MCVCVCMYLLIMIAYACIIAVQVSLHYLVLVKKTGLLQFCYNNIIIIILTNFHCFFVLVLI